MGNKKVNIFLADDHHVFREGIRILLENEEGFMVVAEAGNGNEVLAQLPEIDVNVILLDIDMPDMDGLVLMKKLKVDFSNIPVLVLSSHDDEQYVHHMMKNGASGYLLKSCKKDELVNAINTVTDGGTYLNKSISLKLFQFDESKKSDLANKVSLSERELDVLKLVAKGHTNVEIGKLLFISHRTVDTHRRNMMTKLDLHNAAALTNYAYENKLL